MGTSAETMREALALVPGLSTVTVIRNELDFCQSDRYGNCGPNIGNGFGYNYQIYFEGLTISRPSVTVTNTSLAGILELGGGNTDAYGLVTSAVLTRAGYSVQTTTDGPVVAGVNGQNYWLVPYWLLIFDESHSPPPSDLATGKNVSIYRQYFTRIESVEQIVLPAKLKASYVKIQRDGYGPLSLAEVEVYSVAIASLNFYSQGSPVKAVPVTSPYQPVAGFGQAFGNLLYSGRWTLEVLQDTKPSVSTVYGWSGAEGTLSEWVLLITDLAGVLTVYYQDLAASITSLPKYGTLSKTVAYTSSEYGVWRDYFEVQAGGQLVPSPDTLRRLGVCYGVDTTGMNGVASPIGEFRYCPQSFGVPPTLGTNDLGDIPLPNFIRAERLVLYQPALNYLGPDYFTYVIYDGTTLQSHVANSFIGSTNEVEINVRYCRLTASANRTSVEPMCVCAQTEKALVNNKESCLAARYSLCQSTLKTHFVNLCMTCSYLDSYHVTNRTDTNTTYAAAHLTADCINEIVRAVGFFVSRSLCTLSPPPDCATETLTRDGLERANYLTLRPYISPGSFTPLGNSYGGYGWFDSGSLV